MRTVSTVVDPRSTIPPEFEGVSRWTLELHNGDLNPLCRCVYDTHADRRALESTVDASSAHVVAARGGRFARR